MQLKIPLKNKSLQLAIIHKPTYDPDISSFVFHSVHQRKKMTKQDFQLGIKGWLRNGSQKTPVFYLNDILFMLYHWDKCFTIYNKYI